MNGVDFIGLALLIAVGVVIWNTNQNGDTRPTEAR